MNDVNFTHYLNENAERIDLGIEDYFTLWIKENTHLTSPAEPLLTRFKDASKGGKRIRGTLVLLGYSLVLQKLLTSKEEKAIMQVAVAYEIFQTAILAHDDIIDKSELRRGIPTLYHKLGGNHYGISQTISLGDLGFFIAYKIITESQFSGNLKSKAIAFFSDSLTKTVVGQMLDVEFAYKKIAVSEDLLQEIVHVYTLKTAHYTFVAPLSLGAILAGADKNLLESLKMFGEYVGVLFQLQDDVQDIFGNPKNAQKDIGADIKEGKMTLLYAKAMQKATDAQRRFLSKHYGQALIDKKVLSEIQAIFIETGALTYVKSMTEKFENKARKLIPHIAKEKSKQHMLREIVAYVSKKEVYG